MQRLVIRRQDVAFDRPPTAQSYIPPYTHDSAGHQREPLIEDQIELRPRAWMVEAGQPPQDKYGWDRLRLSAGSPESEPPVVRGRSTTPLSY
jgi:hypothetical protein